VIGSRFYWKTDGCERQEMIFGGGVQFVVREGFGVKRVCLGSSNHARRGLDSSRRHVKGL